MTYTKEQVGEALAEADKWTALQQKINSSVVYQPIMSEVLAAALRDAWAERDRLREALKWYADPENYSDDDWAVKSVIQPPEYGNPGAIARAAIMRKGE